MKTYKNGRFCSQPILWIVMDFCFMDVSGILGMIWGLFCLVFGADSPAVHKSVTPEERNYIESNMGNPNRKEVGRIKIYSVKIFQFRSNVSLHNPLILFIRILIKQRLSLSEIYYISERDNLGGCNNCRNLKSPGVHWLPPSRF